MNEARQRQAERQQLVELEEDLLSEIQGPPGLNGLGEYEKRSWHYIMRYLIGRLQETHALFQETMPQSLRPLRWESLHHRAAGLALILTVARSLNDSEATSLSLAELADRLSTEGALEITDPDLAIQVVFHIVGWLTGIWDSVWTDPLNRPRDAATLRINAARAPGRRGAYWHNVQSVTRTEMPVEEVKSSELHRLMGRNAFGKLLPVPEQALRPRIPSVTLAGSSIIPKAYLSWHALESQRYQLAWTSTGSEHLQIDQRHRILFLYKHPSLYWSLYKRKAGNFLTRIFAAEQKEREEQPTDETGWRTCFEIEDFYDDVLRSYLLLFDNAALPRLIRPTTPKIQFPDVDFDPLLRDLCTGSANNPIRTAIMRDFETPPASGDYVALDDFPFLGKRLGVISEIGKGSQSPNRLWKLWVDRMNPNGWTVRWVTLFFVASALLLQFPQTIASLIQLFMSPPESGLAGKAMDG